MPKVKINFPFKINNVSSSFFMSKIVQQSSVTRFKWQHFKSICLLFASQCNIWQNVEHLVQIFQCLWAHFYSYKWQTLKSKIAIRSHCSKRTNIFLFLLAISTLTPVGKKKKIWYQITFPALPLCYQTIILVSLKLGNKLSINF